MKHTDLQQEMAYLPDHLPLRVREYLKKAHESHFNIVQKYRGFQEEKCVFCGGIGLICYDVYDPESVFRNQQNKPPGTEISYVCPNCGKDKWLPKAWAQSGLLDSDHNWHIEFIEGFIGKENAFRITAEIIANIESQRGLYVYYGDFGVGKSGILKSVVIAGINSGVISLYIRAEEILAKFRSAYQIERSESEEELTKYFANIPIIAIDEVDRISDTSWANSKLMTILDRRHETRESTLTIMATNLQVDKMPDNFGYLQSRLKDSVRIFVGGIDLRGMR